MTSTRKFLHYHRYVDGALIPAVVFLNSALRTPLSFCRRAYSKGRFRGLQRVEAGKFNRFRLKGINHVQHRYSQKSEATKNTQIEEWRRSCVLDLQKKTNQKKLKNSCVKTTVLLSFLIFMINIDKNLPVLTLSRVCRWCFIRDLGFEAGKFNDFRLKGNDRV